MAVPSRFKTITLPSDTTGAPAPKIVQGGRVPMRILIRNTGAGVALISATPNDLNLRRVGGVGGNLYLLPVAAADTFVLAPYQTLYGITFGAGTTAVSISDAEAVLTPND